MKHLPVLLLLILAAPQVLAHGDDKFALVGADRLEYQSDPDAFVWDLEGWYGGDISKLWIKAEGEAASGESAEGEVELLYNRAVWPYFDLQLGVRYEDEADDASLVVGIHGDAPYRIDLDVSAYLTEHGDVLVSGEFERDFLLTRRFVLQPRLEIELAAQDIAERAVSSGITETALGLRLRYEINRKFAPYLGVSWQRSYGDTARALRAVGEDDSLTTFVVGAWFWF